MPFDYLKSIKMNPFRIVENVFTFPEGDVRISFPFKMSQESFRELTDHLAIVMRGLERRSVQGRGDETIVDQESDAY